MLLRAFAGLALAFMSNTASAAELTREAIEAATFSQDDGLPSADEQSPLGLKLQVLLDRAGISPGVLDGYHGTNVEVAVSTFAEREGMESEREFDAEIWERLGGDSAEVLTTYEITPEDVEGPFVEVIPDDFEAMAEMERLAYTSPEELLAEKFHMHIDVLRALNPDADFGAAGTEIVVAAVRDDLDLDEEEQETRREELAGTVARVEVDKDLEQVRGYDTEGELLVAYPATIGSQQNPSPSGTTEVVVVVRDPNYTYTPESGIDGPDEALQLPPGPNGPVGSIWIDLAKEGYGIHGTADPAQIRRQQSHGCVRLTNWDAEELADLVDEGTTVEFLESGEDGN
jgi:lipoprotein-anchoring transpeptidase ErfK/SrfK